MKSQIRIAITAITGLISMSACSEVQLSDKVATVPSCKPIEGVEAVLDSPLPRVIILGELHGMDGPPNFAKALVCHSLARGYRTALGFEMSDDAEQRLKIFLASKGSEDARIEMFNHTMWTNDFTDGRSSEAMLALLDYARITQQSESSFKPFFFQSTDVDWSQYEADPNAVLQANEKGMAENILSFSQKNEIDKTIILVGNLHAKRAKNPFGDHDYDFMAVHMPAPETLTLSNLYGSGTSWNCLGSITGETVCGASDTQGNVDPDSELAKTENYEIKIIQSPTAAIKGYDGWFYVGAANASKPANLAGRMSSEP